MSTVAEDSADRSNDDESNATDRAETTLASVRAASEFSGTIASSQGAEEAADLDVDFAMESLPDLWTEATKVLKKAVPLGASVEQQLQIIRDLKHPGSAIGRTFNRALQQLKALHEDPFHADNNSYINHEIVLRSLFGDAFAAVPLQSNPNDVIFKANLAIFAADVLLSEHDGSKTSERFQSLDLEFPQLFLSALKDPRSSDSTAGSGSSTLLQDTFELALELRTQNAIMLLKSQRHRSSFDPDYILAQNFLNGPPQRLGPLLGREEALQQASIRGWQVDGLRDIDDSFPVNFRPAVIDRLNNIGLHLLTDLKDKVDIDGLDTMFPWEDFLARAAEWIHHRHQEIDSHVEQFGGVNRIFERISAKRETDITQNGTTIPNPRPGVVQRGASATTQLLPKQQTVVLGAAPASTSALDQGRRPTGGRK